MSETGEGAKPSSQVLIQEMPLDSVGGAQKSNENILRHFFGPESNLIYVSPHPLPFDIDHEYFNVDGPGIPMTDRKFPSLSTMRKTRKMLKARNPDHIILDEPGTYAYLLFRFGIPRSMREKTVATWRSEITPGPEVLDDDSKLVQGGIKMWSLMRKKIAREAGLNLCISPHLADQLLALGVDQEKIKIIPEQIGGEFTPALRKTDKENLRRTFLDDNELGVLIVSRVAPEKGLSWVPDLIKQLRIERRYISPDAPYKKIKITLAGPVADQTSLNYKEKIFADIHQAETETSEHHAADSISFEYIGELQHDELEKRYNSYDILLNPSPKEGFGRVTVEAMNAGMTVIGNAECEGTSKILSAAPYQIGSLASTPEETATQILHLMKNTDELEQRQYNALAWSLGEYRLEKAKNAFLKALEN